MARLLPALEQVDVSGEVVSRTCGFSGDHLTFQTLRVGVEKEIVALALREHPMFQKRFELLLQSA